MKAVVGVSSVDGNDTRGFSMLDAMTADTGEFGGVVTGGARVIELKGKERNTCLYLQCRVSAVFLASDRISFTVAVQRGGRTL
jgi:hypothetical protein